MARNKLFKNKKSHLRIFSIAVILLLLVICLILSQIIYHLPQARTKQSEIEDIALSRPWQRIILSNSSKPRQSGEYPNEVFTFEQNRQGAVVLYIIGITYMFLGLSIVCDEFFVPSLHVITEILAISDDVAGATFMAAGGSAPELFTSFLGVFVAKTHIGFGTIVGSAVFNVLFVIGMCVIFSKSVLHLTWWPLLRDSIFYSCSLGLLIAFFSDSKIEFWESTVMFVIYLIYVSFMYFNERIERNVKSFIASLTRKNAKVGVKNDVGPLYRNGALQLVIHTLDPISEATAENKFHQIKAILEVEVKTQYKDPKEANIFVKEKYRFEHNSSRQVFDDDGTEDNLRKKAIVNNFLVDGKDPKAGQCHNWPSNNTMSQYTYTNYPSVQSSVPRANSECSVPGCGNLSVNEDESSSVQRDRGTSVTSANSRNWSSLQGSGEGQKVEKSLRFSGRVSRISRTSHHDMSRLCLRETSTEKENSICEDDEPLTLTFPDSILARIWYIIKLPIILALMCTLPDVRRPKLRKLFVWTFLGSIIWIGGFSYFMVWFASVTGDVLGIPQEVMGLTFLAAGTSIPDLITSVLVARQGLGDMAVSSSIGSNLFDVTVGLPIPWFVWSAVHSFEPMIVKSNGLFCSTFLLFFMLLAVVASIAMFKWRMTKRLAAAMFLLYAAFLTISLLIEFNIIPCFL
eukprot:gene10140-11175_t